MRAILSNLFTIILTLCALLVTGLVVRRELFLPAPGAQHEKLAAENWREVVTGGSVIGKRNAPVKIVVFSDFQCPFCATARLRLKRLQEKSITQVAIVYRHFPITNIHAYALAAAMASECAGAQSRFEDYHDALFAAQDSIGLKSWQAYAEAAGVPNMGEFGRCVSEQRFEQRVMSDFATGKRIGVNATPTFVFDGQMVSGAGALEELDDWVSRALGGRLGGGARGGGRGHGGSPELSR